MRARASERGWPLAGGRAGELGATSGRAGPAGAAPPKAGGGRGAPSDMRLWAWVLRLGLLSAALGGCGVAGRPPRAPRTPARTHARPDLANGTPGPATCATRVARARRPAPPPPPKPGGAWDPAWRGPRRRQPRAARDGAGRPQPSGRALYFAGRGEALRLRADLELPRDAFTLQVWLRAEGGQRAPAVITGRNGEGAAGEGAGWGLGGLGDALEWLGGWVPGGCVSWIGGRVSGWCLGVWLGGRLNG